MADVARLARPVLELVIEMRAGRAQVPAIRQVVKGWLLERGLDDARRGDALLVVAELLNNAVEAGRGGDVEIGLRLLLSADRLRISVRDDAPGVPEQRRVLAAGHAPVLVAGEDPGGWGLGIVKALSVEFGVRRAACGKTVFVVVEV
ncbi:ATP-binding protein [Actinomadura parmotrematis]|uniref:ATP-binding protein n=1 Tax=Actinomadura parmotrematis TaxID=2864039 RepID=A0ABS7FMF3_9ACTN|nr:ATP-binding protein [Actinomadura parmotrematis]MBW8481563.1 ATP-binding protein [Actinomadura parmotrematis]